MRITKMMEGETDESTRITTVHNPLHKTELPSLTDCISLVKLIPEPQSASGQRNHAEIFSASMALLCHLKLDQELYFQEYRNAELYPSRQPICPSHNSTPAITAVLEDSSLFQCLLQMLSTKDLMNNSCSPPPSGISTMINPNKQQTHVTTSSQNHQHSGIRKRSASGNDVELTKANKKQKYNSSFAAIGNNSSSSKISGSKSSLPMDQRVYAATVLYTCIRHLNHWPAPLVKAYAEDCFGERLWVDDEHCKYLVQNLSIMHNTDTSEDPQDQEALDSAEGVANRHANYVDCQSNDIVSIIPPTPFEIPSSFSREYSEYDSSDSDSGDEVIVVEEMSVGSSSNMASRPSMLSLNEINESHNIRKNQELRGTLSRQESAEEVAVEGGESIIEEKISNINKRKIGPPSIPHEITATTKRRSLQSTSTQSKLHQNVLNLTNVRPRYIGANRNLAHRFISDALSARLQSKMRHYSRLLTTLQDFTAVPKIRALIARNLERWLQSPALSGLARNLFSLIVKNMKNIDPALPDDIDVINSILSMNLKANQIAAHIENITEIARTIPTLSTFRHIFLHLLRAELTNIESPSNLITPSSMQSSDFLKMFVAVHSVIPPGLAADALASSLLALAFRPIENISERHLNVQRICLLLHNISDVLGSSYDGCAVLKSILTMGKGFTYGLIENYHLIARIVFECIALVGPSSPTLSSSTGSTSFQQRSNLKGQQRQRPNPKFDRSARNEFPSEVFEAFMTSRKLVLAWCVNDYAAMFHSAIQKEEADNKALREKRNKNVASANRHKRRNSSDNNPMGAGPPDFSSALDGTKSAKKSGAPQTSSESFMAKIRCLLFLNDIESAELNSFLSLSDNFTTNLFEPIWNDWHYRISFCSAYGTDVDDEIIKIILKSASQADTGISFTIALELIESILLKCKLEGSSVMCFNDSNIVWDLYNLTEYIPIKINSTQEDSSSSVTGDKKAHNSHHKQSDHEKNSLPTSSDLSIRVAYPGQWWRVTCIALILCGASPEKIGSSMWEMHPTLQSLIKMTVSGKYRFPTADCNESEKEEMKKNESNIRDQELKLAEKLFLPKSMTLKKRQPSSNTGRGSMNNGSRISMRQREKQERALKQKQKEEAAQDHADAQKMKKMLRSAQKSIMIFDPKGVARKPPKESINLLLDVDAIFGLSDAFRRSASPDFLMKTIGGTSRDYIERAYDWLIPIISSSQHIIERLPPSASCFLLLRAYGTDGYQKNTQLLELAAPLLDHIRKCLKGTLGEIDSSRAANLLLTDVSDASPDRRRCARKVLQEAIGSIDSKDHLELISLSIPESWLSVASLCRCDWLFNLLRVEYTTSIMIDAIKFVSHALAYERGRTLSSYALALCSYIDFLKKKDPEASPDFVSILCNLLSARPQVCAVAMELCPSFRDMGIDTIHNEWKRVISIGEDNVAPNEVKVLVYIDKNDNETNGREVYQHVFSPLPLLHAAILLLSNWKEDKEADEPSDYTQYTEPDNKAVLALANDLIVVTKNSTQNDKLNIGLAGATFHNGERAIHIDQWVLLAKSRCAFIARHAALSAPLVFLPRLILCCGLPHSSLFTIIGRLGGLGDSSNDLDRAFRDLLSPSSVSEWGLGNIGNRRAIARKLLGRISAYLRIYRKTLEGETREKEQLSSTFVLWLSEQCPTTAGNDQPKKKRGKKNSGEQVVRRTNENVGAFLTNVKETLSSIQKHPYEEAGSSEDDISINSIDTQINSAAISNDDDKLQDILDKVVGLENTSDLFTKKFLSNSSQVGDIEYEIEQIYSNPDQNENRSCKMAFSLLSTLTQERKISSLKKGIVMKWVPLLTKSGGDSSIWNFLFKTSSFRKDVLDNLLYRCVEVWSIEHIHTCQLWILSEMKSAIENQGPICSQFVKFLVMTSEQYSIHQESYFGGFKIEKPNWIKSDLDANATILFALDCAKIDANLSQNHDTRGSFEKPEDTNRSDNDSDLPPDFETGFIFQQYKKRNVLPDWLVLVLMVARCNKNLCSLVANRVMESLSQQSFQKSYLQAILLRVYAYFPTLMNLRDAVLRQTLLDAASAFAQDWIEWRCPIDKQLNEMLMNLAIHPNHRLLQSISELSRKHPLLVARQQTTCIQILEEDANSNGDEKKEMRGRVHGNKKEFINAETDNGNVKVKIRHWGYSFTEPLWDSILELLSSVHNEVIFSSCGVKMGLFELLGVYVKLIATQMNIKCDQNIIRIRSKLITCLSSFKVSNRILWDDWQTRRIEGIETWGTVEEVAKKCNLEIENEEENKS